MLTLTIDRGDSAPVYEQVADQLRRLIACGDLPVGALLPPIRRLAGDLGVGLNTVARAYRALGDEGFLVARDRTGVAVAARAKRADATAQAELLTDLRATLARMSQGGLSGDELSALMREELRTLASRDEEARGD